MTARIAPVQAPYSDEVGAVLASMSGGREPIGLFRLLARNLPMAAAMGEWGSYELGRRLSLPLRLREIAIDRVCARCGCEYEWGVHVLVFAGKAGLTEDEVASLTWGGAEDPCWTGERERLVISCVDALHDTSDLDDELWARLAAVFSQEQRLDLLLLSGWYHAIAFAARSTRLPPEPGTPRFADYKDPHPQGTGATQVES